MTSPAITVIVPGWNVAGYAPAALASLRAQTREDRTAVLVDDRSNDTTAEVFATAAASDRRFRLGHGRVFALYVMGYTLGRGWIEYLRIDDVQLRDVLGLKVRLVLVPDPELSEMPLQKYYRFALDARSPRFDVY